MTPEDQKELIPLNPGDVLRHEREKLGMSVKQAAQQVRVKPAVITAIESGDTGHIPSVYLKGYIRSYARHLGLTADAIEKHMPQAQGSEPAVQSIFKTGLPTSPGDRWFKASSYVLASAVVIALVWQFTNEAVRFSEGGSMMRSAGTAEQAAAAVNAGDSPGGNGSTAAGPEAGRAANTHLRASVAPLQLARDGRPSDGQKIAESAWAAVTGTAPVTVPFTADTANLMLEISTSADSWIEITDRTGAQVEMDLLRAGTRRSYTGEGPFRLLIGRASSVELAMNGDKINLAPYTRGNVARVTLGEPASEAAAAPANVAPANMAPDPDQAIP